MGTTRTAILDDSGVRLGYVLCIEGYSKLLTTAADVSKVTTAWSGTLWSSALPGLSIEGNVEQRFNPLSNDLQIPTLSFRMLDPDDTFGRDVFRSKPNLRTQLDVSFDASHSSFDITGKSVTSDWPASGVLYVGTKAYAYGSRDTGAGTFTVSADGAGYYSPFGTSPGSDNRFPGAATVPSNEQVGGWESTRPPLVTDTPRTFVGKRVGLWAHRISGGAWDTKAQAELIFAGIIDSVDEAGLATIISCSGIQALIRDTTLLVDQWSGRLKEGRRFVAGESFSLEVITTSNAYAREDTILECVSGASGTSEFEPGYYTAEAVGELIETWAAADSNMSTYEWTAGVRETQAGPRFIVSGSGGSMHKIVLRCSSKPALRFLGFATTDGTKDWYRVFGEVESGANSSISSDGAPFRVEPFGALLHAQEWQGSAIELEAVEGTFVDTTDHLTPEALEYVGDEETWSFFSIGEKLIFLARKDSATDLSEVHFGSFGGKGIGIPAPKFDEMENFYNFGVRIGESLPVVKQVVVMADSLQNVLTKLLASVDGNGSNHATYDVYSFGAAIPWGLLGDNWINSLAQLEQGSNQGSMVLILTKPERLWDVIKAELIMRAAFVVWKDGGLQVATLQTPNASNADWTLDETNKAEPAGRSSMTQTQHTSEYLINNVKIEYNRDVVSGKYEDQYLVRDIPSIQDYGLSKPLTIKANNSWKQFAGTGTAVEHLAEIIAARLIPPFARPLKRYKRSMCHQLFFAAPGDTVAFSDNIVRSPTTGARGVSARAGTVLSASYSFGVGGGSYNGELEILYTEEDRMFPMSPAAESDESLGASAWDSGTNRLYVKEHAFGETSDDNDNTRFADDDAVRIIECDPDDPTSPDTFTDVIDGAPGTDGTGDYVTLADGFGGSNPSFDSSKIYRVVSDAYSSAESSQQLQAYQAQKADGLIEDTIEANLWGEEKRLDFTAVDLTDLPARYSDEQFGDGAPLNPALLDDAIRMANNLVNVRTAACGASVDHGSTATHVFSTSALTSYQIIWVQPLYIGNGVLPAGKKRMLTVAPIFRSAGGSPADVNIRVWSAAEPPNGDTYDDVTAALRGPKQSATFTTTTTTAWVIPTAQEIRVVRAAREPLTYLVVEGSGVNGGSFLGLARCDLGVLE